MKFSKQRTEAELAQSQKQNITVAPKQLFNSGFYERSWLKNHGKQQYISFSDKALVQLRKYFNSLDQHSNGSIGVDQLEDPFIAFGLSQNREEVQQLIKCKYTSMQAVDLDGSGKIQFDEFLEIMLKIKRGKSGNTKNAAMFDFFHRMITGKLGEQFDNNMPFKLNVSQFRRKKILQSIMSDCKQKKQKGHRILQNFKKQIINHPDLKETLNESKKSSSLVFGIDYKTAPQSNKRANK